MIKKVPTVAICTASVAALTLALSGCGSGSSAGGQGESGSTVNVGLATALSGATSQLGHDALKGIQAALHDINADGGLLGKKIKLVTADNASDPQTGATNARDMILSKDVKALFGPVSANVALAEQSVAAPQHIPLLYSEIATTSMTSEHFSKYAFRIRPNTVSGARAAAEYVKNLTTTRPLTIYSVSPDYSYGHELTAEFMKALESDNVQYKVLGQQYPQLGSTSFTNYITAVNSVNPALLFLGIYGGDWTNFVKQASRTGTFKKTTSVQLCNMSSLATIKEAAPSGEVCFEFAPPIYTIKTDRMKKFIQSFQKQYNSLPNDEQTLAYESAQAWAQAVKKAGSFDGTKVAEALSGLTVEGVASTFTIRPCDHQATVPVYAGTIGSDFDQKWQQKLLENVKAIPASKTLKPCG